MIASDNCVFGAAGEEVASPQEAARADHRWSGSLSALYRIGLPIALWIVFVNVAAHYHPKGMATDAILHDVVEAELASRRCPGLRLDPVSFRELSAERGINHADIYQKRSPRLRKAADQLERRLRDNPERACRQMWDLYGGAGPEPRLLTRAGSGAI
jgi:hypothetical protein